MASDTTVRGCTLTRTLLFIRRHWLLSLSACAGFVGAIVLWNRAGSDLAKEDVRSSPTPLRKSVRSRNGSVVPPLEPRGAVLREVVETWWMLPDDVKENVRGVLVAFHGCNHGGGYDLFRLPEDRVVAQEALNRGLAVVAFTSQDRSSGCWSQRDAQILSKEKVMDEWFRIVAVSPQVPVVAIGASSGGSFLFDVWKVMPLRSMAAYITPASFDSTTMKSAMSRKKAETDESDGGDAPPATAYVHMPRDERTGERVSSNVEELQSVGITSKEWKIPPHPFTPSLCRQRLPEFRDEMCDDVLERWKSEFPELIGQDYSILVPPQSGRWSEAMTIAEEVVGESYQPSAEIWGDGLPYPSTFFHGWSWTHAVLHEEVAASFGVHEMVAEGAEQILDWLLTEAGL